MSISWSFGGRAEWEDGRKVKVNPGVWKRPERGSRRGRQGRRGRCKTQ